MNFSPPTVAMEASMQTVISAIHASPTRAVVYLAGGASQAIGWLLSVPRASETILEVSIPYSRISMFQMLGKTPMKYVSEETAQDIATAAYNRSLQLSRPVSRHTCSWCRFYWYSSFCNSKAWRSQGLRDRAQEDFVASQLLIKALASASGINMNSDPDFHENERLQESVTSIDNNEQIRLLLAGTICMLPFAYGPDGLNNDDARRVVLPGSFNPLHEGHLKLIDTACKIISGVPIFEISVKNADKPALSIEQIKSRLSQFEKEGRTVVFTNQPYFFKKAELLPNSTFVIGADTAIRLVDPKYYDGSFSRMLEVLHGIQHLGCDFLVAGRKIGETFMVLSDLNIPTELKGLFKTLPAEAFRVDISSTEIRRREKENSSDDLL